MLGDTKGIYTDDLPYQLHFCLFMVLAWQHRPCASNTILSADVSTTP